MILGYLLWTALLWPKWTLADYQVCFIAYLDPSTKEIVTWYARNVTHKASCEYNNLKKSIPPHNFSVSGLINVHENHNKPARKLHFENLLNIPEFISDALPEYSTLYQTTSTPIRSTANTTTANIKCDY